ncbi:glycoside hydrolase family 130 protein [Sphingomonas sp. AR_OL41]|uniref:glycoside hydrolase family 130 protein n=1 Tax=Sphingomonas sp. AR_OL41 TaxID=3042729 RepID=UPI00248074AE|nr:glycoside hydrolase family 130 protein [Sphingomonas sp. AR_OL41]MDH7972427.1 glycoside hydrolase family 130 protein [Sphingomonas sp. AR_OL41]
MLRPFVPAENGDAGPSGSRVERIVDRVLGLSDAALRSDLSRVTTSLADRHRDVERVLERRYYDMAEPFARGRKVSAEQVLLIGAYFAEEYSFEAAALFNPSIVAHPDQSRLSPGAVRFVLSLRGVGEGHISSMIFRTGEFTAEGALRVNPPSPWATSPTIENIPGGAPGDPGVRLFYGDEGDLSQIVIFPVTFDQRHGVEDLRLVRFTDDDGHVSYFGTYTAFGGETVRQELLRTDDFVTFELNALSGSHSGTKGMALFPRRIDGRYAMLGRQDHENIWLLQSNDLYQWGSGAIIVSPRWEWEFVQMGNCGSPIEIDEGWLVITHGVGPIRNYCLGACLLDKRDPAKVIARSTEPLLRPSAETRDGYVPNVVYSCGAMVVGRTLLLPYGVADSFTAFASVPLDRLLATLR